MPFSNEQVLFASAIFLYGLVFGSFFNVLIYRLPRGESIIFPPSHCPNCNRKILWRENIPILSFMLLGGRCKECKAKISITYPIVELAAGLYSVALFALFFPQIQSPQNWWCWIEIFFRFFTLLLFIPLALIDIKHYIIPDELTVFGIITSLLISFLPQGITPFQSIIGALGGGGFLFAAGFIAKLILKRDDAMGDGDVKFLFWIGALFGIETALSAIFIGSAIGTFVSIILILSRKTDATKPIPFCPYLCAGTLAVLILSDKIIQLFRLT
jgi:leader peptidase (prepilin peptidase)/N-methyltransferase